METIPYRPGDGIARLAVAYVTPAGSIRWLDRLPFKLAWELAGLQDTLNDHPGTEIPAVEWFAPATWFTAKADRDPSYSRGH